jgi:hypothetical protein
MVLYLTDISQIAFHRLKHPVSPPAPRFIDTCGKDTSVNRHDILNVSLSFKLCSLKCERVILRISSLVAVPGAREHTFFQKIYSHFILHEVTSYSLESKLKLKFHAKLRPTIFLKWHKLIFSSRSETFTINKKFFKYLVTAHKYYKKS